MADIRELFPILEDQSTKEGKGWSNVAAGDAAAGLGAGPVLPCKDEDGKVQYLPMVEGRVLVSTDGTGFAHLGDRGEHAGDKDAFQKLAEVTLTNDYEYSNLAWVCSSYYRETHFKIVQIDDEGGTPVETIHADVATGPGDFTDSGSLPDLKFTAGATGTCKLYIYGKNFEKACTMRASVSIQEKQVA